ncbi:unnamed protein product [Rangifer tarandus platyrhynchus]|uniref:Uncharacterized protein n=1 Tax=Rangifer tarandus platyrhynchus TaxID=3082113 RepID=A0AC59YML8_RANTA
MGGGVQHSRCGGVGGAPSASGGEALGSRSATGLVTAGARQDTHQVEGRWKCCLPTSQSLAGVPAASRLPRKLSRVEQRAQDREIQGRAPWHTPPAQLTRHCTVRPRDPRLLRPRNGPPPQLNLSDEGYRADGCIHSLLLTACSRLTFTGDWNRVFCTTVLI